jgi:1-acyl-sn-glycerol-3-phosphate acyltransferase
MANHQSNFDIPILMVAFGLLQVRWVSKRAVRKVPIIGLCMQRTHQVLVDRESPTQAVAVIRQVKTLPTQASRSSFPRRHAYARRWFTGI